MKYPFRVEYSEWTRFGVPTRKQPIMRLPEEIGVVTDFLLSEAGTLPEVSFMLSHIDRVLRGEVGYLTGGNAHAFDIRKDFTRVVSLVSNEDCTIETAELKEVLLTWRTILREHPEA